MKMLRSENGNTLMIAILILILATVIGISLISMSLNGLQRNETRENVNKATEQAEKGITHLSSLLQQQFNSMNRSQIGTSTSIIAKFNKEFRDIVKQYDCSKKETTHLSNGDSNLKYSVCIKNISDDLINSKNDPVTLTFISKGYANGKTSTIESTFELNAELKDYPNSLDYAVSTHSEGNLILNGGIDIKGNVMADGNIIVSNYGYVPVIDRDGSLWDGTLTFSLNPWKETVYPKIDGFSSGPSIIKVNKDKKLFRMNVTEFKGRCKRPSYLNDIFKNINLSVPVFLTYYDLIHYDFNNITSTTECLFTIKSPTELSQYLTSNQQPTIQATTKQEPININEIIKKGKEKLSTVNKLNYPNSMFIYETKRTDTPTELKIMTDLLYLDRVYLKGSFKTSAIAAFLTKSILDGEFYFDHADLKLANGLLFNPDNILKGSFYFNRTNLNGQSNLKILGGKQSLDGEFYFEKTDNNANGRGLLNKIRDGFDNAIEIDNGVHTIKGVYYVNGDVQIKSSTIQADAIFYVNGDVQIEDSKIESLDGGKLIIFATGDISYQYASDIGTNIGKKYYNQTPVQLNAYFYSNRKIELHGSISNIHLKGGLSAQQILLSGVRGDVEQNLISFEFKNIKDKNAKSRLKIEYDENVIKTVQEIANSKEYSSSISYHELTIEPLRQISREIQ